MKSSPLKKSIDRDSSGAAPKRSPRPRSAKVKKNARGGVLVTNEEVTSAFSALDADDSGHLSLGDMKKRIGVLFPEMTAMDFRYLMSSKKEMSLDDLKDIVLDNDIDNFDPTAEAFKLFQGEDGKLDGDMLRQAFVAFGYGELSEEELQLLDKTIDLDGDGVMSLEDFRGLTEPEALPRAATSGVSKEPSLNQSVK